MTTTQPTGTSPGHPARPRAGAVSAAVLRAEARLFGRELGSVFWIVLFPVVLLLVMGAVPGFRRPDPALGGLAVVDLYVPTTVLLSMVMAALMAMPPVIFGYRESGVLRRLRTTPVRPASLLLAQVLLHAAAVVAASVLVLAAGRLLFGTPLPQSWSGYAVAYLLVLVAAFSMGMFVTSVSPNARVGTMLGTVLFFASMFSAGVYFPVQGMGGWLRTAVELTPLGAAAEAMTAAMVGDLPEPAHLLTVAVWAVVLGAFSVRAFRWE